jgi:hypothetical protein
MPARRGPDHDLTAYIGGLGGGDLEFGQLPAGIV